MNDPITLSEVLEPLENIRSCAGGYTARCPAHDDKHASLSISTGRSGNILLYCHAGCSFPDIVKALGYQESEFFAETDRGRARQIVAEYDYTDEAGALLYQAVRFAPKEFRQRAPDGNGGWKWSLEGVRRVLFHLPQLITAVKEGRPIYVVEGEKDVLTLERHGHVATCNPMGADPGIGNKWRPEFSAFLKGAEVFILPDNDEPGRKHAEWVHSTMPIDTGARIVNLPGLAEHGDVTDWFMSGHTDEEFEAAMSDEDDGLPSPVRLKDFLLEDLPPVNWQLGGLVAPGSIGMLVADGTVGKTTLLIQLTLCMTAGEGALGFNVEKPVPSMMIMAEGARVQIRNRIIQAARNLRVPVDPSWYVQPDKLSLSDFKIGSRGLDALVRKSKAKFIVLDTLGYFGLTDENDANAWKRDVMNPLRDVCSKYDCTFCLVHHTKKGYEDSHAQRGTSAMFDDVDFFLRMDPMKVKPPDLNESEAEKNERREAQARRELWVTKNKYGLAGYPIHLTYDATNALFREIK